MCVTFIAIEIADESNGGKKRWGSKSGIKYHSWDARGVASHRQVLWSVRLLSAVARKFVSAKQVWFGFRVRWKQCACVFMHEWKREGSRWSGREHTGKMSRNFGTRQKSLLLCSFIATCLHQCDNFCTNGLCANSRVKIKSQEIYLVNSSSFSGNLFPWLLVWSSGWNRGPPLPQLWSSSVFNPGL